jgi:predicted phage baseplate assembly protein
MPLEAQAPVLDTRTFEDVFRTARQRIPRYTPEWTDFNESDPGITIVRLFAWLTELMLFELNRVPELNYVKFLQLLGLELDPPAPAQAHVTFTPTPELAPPVPAGTQLSAQPADGGDLLVFETEKDLSLVRLPLTDVQVWDGFDFNVVAEENATPGVSFPPLGWVPQTGSALYLGFSQTEPPSQGRLFPQELRLRIFLPEASTAGLPQRCVGAAGPPLPSAQVAWEYRPTATATYWRRLDLYEDESASFTREGYIAIEGPPTIEPTVEGRVPDPRYWIRSRLVEGGYPAGRPPEIDFLRTNTVPAVNLTTVREEEIGESDGRPNQAFRLRRPPLQPDSLDLRVRAPGEEEERWERVPDFLASGPDGAHYVITAATGELRFGDGTHGRIPTGGALIVASSYRSGGGAAGNVGPGQIDALLAAVAGTDAVVNERAAEGGSDEERVEDLKRRAPSVLRHRGRAVTPEDFAALAKRAGGVADAIAIGLAHPDHPDVDVPGAVTVAVLPEAGGYPPTPSEQLLHHVCSHLDRYRLLTTELFVKGPTYQAVSVEALVTADPQAALDAVERDVVATLDERLDPRRWPFGDELFPTSLYSDIHDVAGVAAVKQMSILLDGRPRDLTEPVRVPPDGLVYGTAHRITVARQEDI